MWMVRFEQKLYKDSQKSGQESSRNGVEKTEDMNVCGGYRTESFGIIVWKRYDKKYRTDTISVRATSISVTITIKR